MRILLAFSLAAALLFSAARDGRAAPTLSLMAVDPVTKAQLDSGGSLTLNAGQTVEIDVILNGLDSGATLDYLDAQMSVADSFFQTVTTPQAGKIVTDADPNAFSSSNGPPSSGSFDVNFTDPGGSPIFENGIFYSFNITAPSPSAATQDTISVTSGNYEFAFPDQTAFASASLPSIQVTVNPADSGVPEPATLGLGLSGVILAGVQLLWSRRSGVLALKRQGTRAA